MFIHCASVLAFAWDRLFQLLLAGVWLVAAYLGTELKHISAGICLLSVGSVSFHVRLVRSGTFFVLPSCSFMFFSFFRSIPVGSVGFCHIPFPSIAQNAPCIICRVGSMTFREVLQHSVRFRKLL